MFDFFIEIRNKENSTLLNKEIFSSEKLCNQINCFRRKIEGENIKALALSKDEQFPSILDTDKYTVFIYGYCFTRLDSKETEKKRLYADDILNIYNTEAKNITSVIKGSYSILIYDKKQNSLEVFTDELNLRSLYYAHVDDKLIISSSLSAFSKYSAEHFSSVNIKSVVEYALFDFVLTDETFVSNVKSIPNASCLCYVNNNVTIDHYWDIFSAFEDAKPSLNNKESFIQVEQLLKSNLALYLSDPEW
ncbi:MAG: hypothetical protein B6I20_13975 [Bacteroidetes bacterium 4572_117]|nr:MAG: hypothetical protein B6I20_13975 [Bacteroidetes bacterium 4572_117]